MSTGDAATRNEDVSAAIDVLSELVHAPVLSLSAEEISGRLVLAQRLRSIADAVVLTITAAAEDVAAAPNAGLRTTAQLVASQTNVDAASVGRDVSLGRWLRDFPEFADAFASGDLTRTHLRKLRESDSPRLHFQLRADQSIFVDAGRDCSYRDFLKALRYWAIRHDIDGAEPKDQVAKTSVSWRENVDGSVEGKFYFDPLSGAAFKKVLTAETEKLRKSDLDSDISRTTNQRQAAAVIAIFARAAGRADGSFPAPLIDIVMSERVAAGILERIEEDTVEPFPIDADDPDGRCELIDGTPIHPYFVMAAMSVGRFQRHVFDANERVIRTSHSRIFPNWMKHIFHIESRGRCKTPGCDAPFHWLQADHVTPHSKHGPTSLGNGENRCAPDNMWKSDRSDAA